MKNYDLFSWHVFICRIAHSRTADIGETRKDLDIHEQRLAKLLTRTGTASNTVIYSVADPDPGSGAFLTPGSGIRNRFFSGSRIQDP